MAATAKTSDDAGMDHQATSIVLNLVVLMIVVIPLYVCGFVPYLAAKAFQICDMRSQCS